MSAVALNHFDSVIDRIQGPKQPFIQIPRPVIALRIFGTGIPTVRLSNDISLDETLATMAEELVPESELQLDDISLPNIRVLGKARVVVSRFRKLAFSPG